MVSVQIVDESTPSLGHGRWSIPTHLLKDPPLEKYIQERGNEALEKLKELEREERTDENNHQTIYSTFKRDIMDMARKCQLAIVPKITLKIREREKQLDAINNDTEMSEENKIRESAKITEEMADLKQKDHMKRQGNAAVRNHLEGETMSRYWTQISKDAKTRDIFYALRKPAEERSGQDGEDEYEKDSKRMAELTRDYHENLQTQGDDTDSKIRAECTEDAPHKIWVPQRIHLHCESTLPKCRNQSNGQRPPQLQIQDNTRCKTRQPHVMPSLRPSNRTIGSPSLAVRYKGI